MLGGWSKGEEGLAVAGPLRVEAECHMGRIVAGELAGSGRSHFTRIRRDALPKAPLDRFPRKTAWSQKLRDIIAAVDDRRLKADRARPGIENDRHLAAESASHMLGLRRADLS